MTRMLGMLLLLFSSLAQAETPADSQLVSAHGNADGKIPAWSIKTRAPDGWTPDCCTYAKAIGVDFVIYQGEWSGNPDRVMVLNVWPRKLPSLAAEWKADQANYLKKDPKGKVDLFPVTLKAMACHGMLYQGSDHIDDAVVFCDPGKASGIRFSWSMTVAAKDAQRQQVTALFQQVVEKSLYATDSSTSKVPVKAAGH